jgi:hypothetical protein
LANRLAVEGVGQDARATTGENVALHIPISNVTGIEPSSFTSIYSRLGRGRIRSLPPGMVRSSPEEGIGVNRWTRSDLCHVGVSPLVRPSPGLHGPRDIAAMSNLGTGEAVKRLG